MAAAAPLEDHVAQVDEGGELVRERFFKFLDSFSSGSEPDGERLLDYHAQILAMVESETATAHVDFTHVMEEDIELAEALEIEYYRFEPFLRRALQAFIARDYASYVGGGDNERQREFFVGFYNMPRVERVRQLKTERVGRLVAVSGTVTRTSDVRPELVMGAFTCNKCGLVVTGVEQQFEYTEPAICRNSTCGNVRDWELDVRRSHFVDWQRLRVQENADEIPPGSMPRSVDVVLRGDAVERVKAGDKVVFTGTLIVLPDSSAGGAGRGGDTAVGTMAPGRRGEGFDSGLTGLKKLGVRELTYKMAFLGCSALPGDQAGGGYNIRDDAENESGTGIGGPSTDLSEEDREKVAEMALTPNLYEKMVNSIAPTVFGHGEVKRGVLLMLLGGVHKKTPEGIKLRGDINVCVVGDPSTAKSQFLKYVHGFLPRAVFASGKASSAAGLTASVVRDHETGEFGIEAGALMLADNGICCIDEFDKMDVADQVAIHEAMEQQTISITKAGIQATLNARTSILAAANPLFGRYDRSKTLRANVQISAPIMSRFDLFFVVLDECEEDADNAIARHILRVHQGHGNDEATRPPFSMEELQRYIRFARKLDPEVGDAGQAAMVECYRALRQNDCLGRGRAAYRITVRQLESMVRLSEALARLHLDEEVRPRYVREAYRLLRKSIIHVESDDVVLEDEAEEAEADAVLAGSNSGGSGGGGGGGDGGDGGDSDDEGGDGGGKHLHMPSGDGDADTSDGGAEGESLAEANGAKLPEEKCSHGNGIGAGNTRRRLRRKRASSQPEDLEAPDTEVASESQKGCGGAAAMDVAGAGSASQDEGHGKAGSGRKNGGVGRKRKKRRQITFEQYQAITSAVTTYVRRQEDLTPAGTPFTGARWGQIVDWYIKQHEAEGSGPSDREEMRALVNLVVARLLSKDGVLVYNDADREAAAAAPAAGQEKGEDVADGGGGASAAVAGQEAMPREERLLMVHPNYTGA